MRLKLYYFLAAFKVLLVLVESQFKIVGINEGTEDQVLHARYINAAVQYIQTLTYEEINVQPDDLSTVADQSMVERKKSRKFQSIMQCVKHRSAIGEFILVYVNNGTAFFISLSQSVSVIETIKLLSSATSVPTIQIQNSPWKWSSKSSTQNTLTNYATFISPNAVFANSIPALLKDLDITGEVAVLYDEIYIPDDIINVSFTSPHMNPQFISMETDELLIREQMDLIQAQNIFNIFLLATMTTVQKFLIYLQDYMKSETINWYIVTTDPNPYVCEICYVMNTLWIRPDMNMSVLAFQDFQDKMVDPVGINSADVVFPHDKLMLSFYLDLVTIISDTVKELNESLPSFPSFICSTDNTTTDNTISIIDSVNTEQLGGTFGPYIQDPNGNFFQNIPVKIGNIRDDTAGGRAVKTVGIWSITDGLQEIQKPMLQDFTQSTDYNIAIVLQPPFIEKYTDKDGKIKYQGYCIDMIAELASWIGFTYTLYPVPDNKYGILTSRGDWNGLIREVVYGDADIGLGTLRISSDKENYVDLTVPYYEVVGDLILMLNTPTSHSYFEFMTVLTPNVWACILGAYFFTSFLLWVFDKFSPYGKHEKKKFTIVQCMWYCLTSLIPQGGPDAPKNTSCKVVAATWWLFGFIIISAYTANLAAYLTLTRLQSSITSLDGLSKQYAFRYGAVRGTETEAYLKRMMDIEQRFYNIWKLENMTMTMSPNDRASLAIWDYPVSDKYTNMWKFITDEDFKHLPTSTEQALEWVLASTPEGGFAYIGEGSEIRNIMMTDCRFQIIGTEFNSLPYGIAVQQRSPMKDMLSSVIMNLTRNGWLPSLKEKWWTKNKKKVDCTAANTNQQTHGISVMNIFGVFLVTGVLLIIAIVTLVIEFFYYEEKICVRKYHEHHDHTHPHPPDAKIEPDFDASKYNNYDVQTVEPEKLSYVSKH